MFPLTIGPKQDIQTRVRFPWTEDYKRYIKAQLRIRYNIKTNETKSTNENAKPWTT